MTPQPTPPDTQEKDEAERIAREVLVEWHGLDHGLLIKDFATQLESYAATRTAKLEARIAGLEGALKELRSWNDAQFEGCECQAKGYACTAQHEIAADMINIIDKALASTPTQDGQKASK